MLNAFSVYDVKADQYSAPFFSRNDGTAAREVCEVFRNGDSPYAKFPEDYSLFHTGTFDPNQCELVGCAPRLVYRFVTLKEMVENG